jgi:diaminohydroxyphosphoribosylaminopyrimidine deaminase/5-amino-6-(5-phosphoribosylamino)uracil reductase
MSFAPITPEWHQSGQYWFDLMREYARDEIYASLLMPAPGTVMSDDGAMFLAWAVALRGSGHVSPNPLVGAVLLDRQGGFLSAGAHLKIGGHHAEIGAIRRVTDPAQLHGTTLFVTLEPCAHEGRTPACAKTIAASPIARVVYGMTDPNPLVNGQGADILLRSGKIVQKLDHWRFWCRWLARVFVCNQERQEVFTAMKVASTPTGVIAGDRTKRLWITGERARQMGHFLRLEYDAIVVGDQTVLLDNPSLTIRHPHVKGRTPLRIVLDPKGLVVARMEHLALFQESQEHTVMVVPEGSSIFERTGASKIRVLELGLDEKGHFLWRDLKSHLWDLGCRSLLIEGGGGLYRSAMAAGAVDIFHWFIGADGPENGLKWNIPEPLRLMHANKLGVDLGGDTLVEWLRSDAGMDGHVNNRSQSES